MSEKIKYFILMHIGFLVYASYSIMGKVASKTAFLSIQFLALYAAVFFVLFVYAVIWQQVLKVIPLSVASPNKAICIVWGFVFGNLLFGEEIKPNMIAGAVLIFAGILLLNGEKKHE